MYDVAGRLLKLLESRKEDIVNGYTKLDHSLQCATLAYNDGKDEEYVVCSLLHDVMGGLCPLNHAMAVAVVLSPYISRENHLMLAWHENYQLDNWNKRPHEVNYCEDLLIHERCIEFVDKYDFPAFQKMDTFPLEFFESSVRRVCDSQRNPGS